MEVLPVDIVGLVSAILGISIVLVPVIGITARFALKPTVEALARVFEKRGTEESLQIMERRLSLLESQIENLETSQRRLEETTQFDAQLRKASESPRLPEGGAGS